MSLSAVRTSRRLLDETVDASERDARSKAADAENATNSSVPSAWKNRLLSHLDRYKRYPNAARAQRVEGAALLSFEMDRGGRVLTYYLVRSSGWPELDDEVLAMIERASPLPSAPPELNEQIVQLVVPVRFRM
jgi:periplasmic protein TonB